MNFKLETLPNFEFLNFQICQQTVHRITKFHSHFQLKSKWEGKTSYFYQEINSESQDNYQRTEINQ